MSFDPRLYMRIHAALLERIADGILAGGQRLNIGLIADEFGVSRDSVQRALGLLAEAGMVERWPGLGWYVSESPPGDGDSLV